MPSDLTATDRSLFGRLYDRFVGLVRELGKFGVVGGICFVIDGGIYNLCLGPLGMNTYLAKTISLVVAATAAFLGNRLWTWRHRPKSGLTREYTLYFLFNLVGLLITLACLWLSHSALGAVWPIFQTTLADNIATLGVGTVVGTLFRFYAYRRWVFPEPAPQNQ